MNTNGYDTGCASLAWHYGGVKGAHSTTDSVSYVGGMFTSTAAWYRVHVLYNSNDLTWTVIATKDGDSNYSINVSRSTTAIAFGGNTTYTFTLGGQANTAGGSLANHISAENNSNYSPLLDDFRVYRGVIDATEMEAIAAYDIAQKEMNDTLISMDQQVFANNMILQRNKPVEIYGVTGANKQVTVSFNGQVKTGTSDASGNFSIYLDAMQANATGQTLTVATAGATKTYTNVLVGEVFLGIGQSNMGYPLYEFIYAEAQIKSGAATTLESIDASQEKAKYNANSSIKTQLATYKNNASKLRFYMQKWGDSTESRVSWNTWLCPTTADFDGLASDTTYNTLEQVSFTAVAFATQLQAKLGVPVGVVVNAKGGTRVRQWLSPEAQAEAMPTVSDSSIGGLYNSMTKPMGRYTYAGILWYQGESDIYDISNAANYAGACKALFNTYRAEQNDMELPVFIYQLPQFYGHYADCYWQPMRDLHAQLANEDENIHLINGIDTGDYCNIHPIDKMQLNERAVALALEKIYGQTYGGSGVWGEAPQITSVLKDGNVLRLKFSNVTSLSIAQNPDTYAPAGGNNVSLYFSTDKITFTSGSKLSTGTWVTSGKYWVSGNEIHINLADAGFSASQIASFKYVSYAIENTYSDADKFIYNQYGVPVVPFTNAPISENYTVSISATNGTVSKTTAQVANGGSVTFTTSANTGYEFDKVLVNGVANNSIHNNGTVTLSNINDTTTIEVVYKVKTFTVTASATNGTVNKNSVTVDYNGTATITTTANAGYQFSKVLVNGTQNNAVYSNGTITIANVTKNTTIEVVYVIKTYSVSISVTGGSANANSLTVNHGANVTFTLTPNANYVISSVKVNGTENMGVLSGNTITITNVTASTTVEVVYVIKTYSVSISVTGGSVTGNSTKTVNHGANATFTVTPNSGYVISSLKINGADNLSAYSNGTVTITNVTANTTVVVEFSEVPPTTYQVSITATNGSVVGNATVTVVEGNNAVFTVNAFNGYTFSKAMVNGTVNNAVYNNGTVTISNVTKNTTISIEFVIKTYNVSINAEGATISGNANVTVNHGESATFTVIANNGYELSTLTVNGSDMLSAYSNGTVTVTGITENTSINIVFVIKTYQVRISATGGTVNDNAIITVNHGESATFNVVANTGYTLSGLTVNGISNISAYNNGVVTITNVTENTNVEITFAVVPPTTYQVSISVNGGSVDGESSITVFEGESANFTVLANAGYEFSSLIINNVESNSAYDNGTVTVANITSDTVVEVIFTEIPTTPDDDDDNDNDTVPQYKVTLTYDKNCGTVTGVKAEKYDKGTKLNIVVTTKRDYNILSIKVNGVEIDIDNKTKMQINITVDKATTIEVEFSQVIAGCSGNLTAIAPIGVTLLSVATLGIIVKRKKEN